MDTRSLKTSLALLLALGIGASSGSDAQAQTQSLEGRYASQREELRTELSRHLPTVSEQRQAAFELAREGAKTAEEAAATAQQNLGKVGTAQALINHAKGKWIGGAEKGIADAQEALKNATSDAEREAANRDLAHWQANKEEGLQALAQRTEAFEQAKLQEPKWIEDNQAAQEALATARTKLQESANAVLADLAPFLGTNAWDPKLAKCTVLTAATPKGLAEFAAQGPEKAAIVESLLSNESLMFDMLVAGGARFGQYGQAMEIYTAILEASPKANEGALRRLALATSLEHARPIPQTNAANQPDGPAFVDPVKRYLHFEKAFLDGELDPAFENFSAWEYRFVVNSDAPDEIQAWGREMLRNYRPDHIYNPDYGWRYVSSVRTEVPYGSQNVKLDLPTLHQHQNIIMNGGVCGRRAFFGRFILRSFGIPTWGVTQHKHAALSHWTPKGWVVNLGAGFNASWWDKDDVPMSGAEFLLETQAREHAPEYLRVLRAQWVSRILEEQAHNDRRKVAGGIWSSMGHFYTVLLSQKAVSLGPLGQELAEANEREQTLESAAVSDLDQKVSVGENGTITIPSVAHDKTSGKASAMKSFAGGMQLHCLGGFKASYVVEVPRAGNYSLTAQVATVQTGQSFLLSVNDSSEPAETAVPYTLGMWQQTEPVEVSLAQGKNIIHFELKQGSRGVTIKDFILTPAPIRVGQTPAPGIQ